MQGSKRKRGEDQSPRLGVVLVVVGDDIAACTDVGADVDDVGGDDGHVGTLAVDPVAGWGSAGASHPRLYSDPRHCCFHSHCSHFGC